MAHPNLIEEQRMHLVDSSFLVLFGLLTLLLRYITGPIDYGNILVVDITKGQGVPKESLMVTDVQETFANISITRNL